jgi:2-oxoglutarate ferredoxin oxidoreductase subunit beta
MSRTLTIPALIKKPHTFCSGCGHGIAMRIICEVVEELGLTNKVVQIRGYGCCSLTAQYVGFMHFQTPHGRVCAGASALARCLPEDTVTLAYQGDGDAYTIGLSETLNAAYRNENFVNIVINNRTFAMTGGQMAHTTLEGEVTATSPYGRDSSTTGYPLRFPEIVANSFDPAFVARGSVHSPAEIKKLKTYIRKAFEKVINKEGYSLVEILSPCPTNWHKTPLEALRSIEEEMLSYWQLGVLKERHPGRTG